MRLLQVYLLTILLFVGNTTFAQSNTTDRLRAIKTEDAILYNIDGYSITNEIMDRDFNEKSLQKAYKRYRVKKHEKTSDTSLPFKNFRTETIQKEVDTLIQKTSIYFLETKAKKIQVISFSAINKDDKTYEKEIIQLIYNDLVPESCYEWQIIIDSIDFVGRKLMPFHTCRWMGVNNLQCPYNGQVNWSIHNNLDSAKNSINHQLAITKWQKGGKVISEEYVDVVFEGIETKAKKIIYDFTGIQGLLTSISGGKNLTIYYVAVKVRGQYISCVLSHWNNDYINENGLPALHGEFMELK